MTRTAAWIQAASHYAHVQARAVGALGPDVPFDIALALEPPTVALCFDVLVLPDYPEPVCCRTEVGK